mgnify:CR=1 FL=1
MKVLIWGGEARYRADLPHAVQSLPLELVFCPREQPLESMFPQHADTVFLFVDAIAPVDDALIDRMPGLRLIHSEGVAYNAIDLDAARRRLMDILCNYAGYKRCVPILVFDAYKVRGGTREVEKHHNLYVVYTQEAETADMYIERTTHELAKDHRTRVVSSDGAEQIIVLGNGALRVSARAFAEEVAAVEKEIREFLQN